MVVVKKNWLPLLQIAVSQKLYGPNKTVRGFFVLTLLNGLFVMLAGIYLQLHSLSHNFFIGALYGFIYMLFELPNSWYKRRQGIAAGGAAPKYRWLYALLDKTDSCFGVLLFFYFISDPTLGSVILLFLISVCLHIIFSAVLFGLRLKKSF